MDHTLFMRSILVTHTFCSTKNFSTDWGANMKPSANFGSLLVNGNKTTNLMHTQKARWVWSQWNVWPCLVGGGRCPSHTPLSLQEILHFWAKMKAHFKGPFPLSPQDAQPFENTSVNMLRTLHLWPKAKTFARKFREGIDRNNKAQARGVFDEPVMLLMSRTHRAKPLSVVAEQRCVRSAPSHWSFHDTPPLLNLVNNFPSGQRQRVPKQKYILSHSPSVSHEFQRTLLCLPNKRPRIGAEAWRPGQKWNENDKQLTESQSNWFSRLILARGRRRPKPWAKCNLSLPVRLSVCGKCHWVTAGGGGNSARLSSGFYMSSC